MIKLFFLLDLETDDYNVYVEIMTYFLKKIIPMSLYEKISKSKLLRTYLENMNLINKKGYIGVYKNVKDLTEDLLKKNTSTNC